MDPNQLDNKDLLKSLGLSGGLDMSAFGLPGLPDQTAQQMNQLSQLVTP